MRRRQRPSSRTSRSESIALVVFYEKGRAEGSRGRRGFRMYTIVLRTSRRARAEKSSGLFDAELTVHKFGYARAKCRVGFAK